MRCVIEPAVKAGEGGLSIRLPCVCCVNEPAVKAGEGLRVFRWLYHSFTDRLILCLNTIVQFWLMLRH